MIDEIVASIVNSVSNWINNFFSFIPQILVAIVLLLFFFLLGKISSKLTYKSLTKNKVRITLARLFSNTLFFAIVLLGLFFALGLLNLDKTVTSMLAGIGIIGIALGFAFQDLATNYISGIMIAFQKPFKRGDQLKTNDYFGEVTDISLRTTKMRTLDGLSVLIPNKMVIENPLTNYTETDERRVDLDVGISYAENLDKVRKVTIEAVKKVRGIEKEKGIELFFKEFGDSSINFFVRFWINDARQKSFHTAKSQALENIKKAYDKEGILIPFPIRTLDFGIKGGEKLSKMIRKK